MEVANGLHLNYGDGKVKLEFELKSVLQPKLDELKVKVESGEIDLIKGTDLDKIALIGLIEAIGNELAK